MNAFFLLNLNCTASQKSTAGSDSVASEVVLTDSFYHADVIGVSKAGLIKGKEAMEQFLSDFQNSQGSMQEASSHFKIAVQDKLEYEIGSFTTEKGGQFNNMVIWKKGDGADQRILEVVYEKSTNEVARAEIDQAREKWVKLCNLHNTKTWWRHSTPKMRSTIIGEEYSGDMLI